MNAKACFLKYGPISRQQTRRACVAVRSPCSSDEHQSSNLRAAGATSSWSCPPRLGALVRLSPHCSLPTPLARRAMTAPVLQPAPPGPVALHCSTAGPGANPARALALRAAEPRRPLLISDALATDLHSAGQSHTLSPPPSRARATRSGPRSRSARAPLARAPLRSRPALAPLALALLPRSRSRSYHPFLFNWT